MKLLITGATGFVGKTLVPYLVQHHVADLCLLIRSQEKVDRLFHDLPLTTISSMDDDWREKIISYNPDVVLHMATLFTGKCDKENAIGVINSNVMLTTLLLEALMHTDCQHFINIGTFSEYLYKEGEFFANNLYSASKTAVRPIIQFYQTQSKWKWENVIVYSPYGRHNEQKKVMDYLYDALDSLEPQKFSEGKQVLDFIHVDDMAVFFANLVSKLGCVQDNYVQLYLGTGEGHSLREVAATMEKVSGKKINALWGGYPYRPFDTMLAVAPIEKNPAWLDWKSAISLEYGIKIYFEDQKHYG